jgi:hypothetical protein
MQATVYTILPDPTMSVLQPRTAWQWCYLFWRPRMAWAWLQADGVTIKTNPANVRKVCDALAARNQPYRVAAAAPGNLRAVP